MKIKPRHGLFAPNEYGQNAYIEIVVTDPFGASTTGTIVVSTLENQGPQITAITATPILIERDGLISLEVLASHPQDAELNYDWNAPQDWIIVDNPNQAHSPGLQAPDSPGESATVVVTVTDPTGKQAVASIVVGTFENQAPVIESLNSTPSSVIPGQTSSIEVSAFDPDGAEITYEWTTPTGWNGSSTSSILELTAPDEYGVSGTVYLEVSDGLDTTMASITISTVQNVPPTIANFSASPGIVERSETSMLHVDANHVYGESLSYDWEINNDDWQLAATGNEATLQAPDISDDTVTVTVTVEDNHGGAVSAMVIVQTTPNLPPNVSNFTATPQVVEAGGTSDLQITASDPNGQDLNYTWTLDNGDWIVVADDAQATLQAPDTLNSAVTVTVVIDDGYGGETTAFIEVTTETSVAPTITDLFADFDEWIEQQGTAEVTVVVDNPDNVSLTYDWSASSGWTVDGDGEQVELIAPSGSNVDGTVSVTISDTWGNSDSASLTVRTKNTAPDPFGFEDRIGVASNSLVTSNAVEVTGFDGPLTADCSGCEVSRNGGSFASSIAGFEPGDTIALQLISGGADEAVTAEVSLGDTISEEWTVVSASWGGSVFLTPCGGTGRLGPSQSDCDSAYDNTDLEGNITIIGDGIQVWQVPSDGIYEISTYGAQGGTGPRAGIGGYGARMTAEVELQAGDVLRIAVGQQGGESSAGLRKYIGS